MTDGALTKNSTRNESSRNLTYLWFVTDDFHIKFYKQSTVGSKMIRERDTTIMWNTDYATSQMCCKYVHVKESSSCPYYAKILEWISMRLFTHQTYHSPNHLITVSDSSTFRRPFTHPCIQFWFLWVRCTGAESSWHHDKPQVTCSRIANQPDPDPFRARPLSLFISCPQESWLWGVEEVQAHHNA